MIHFVSTPDAANNLLSEGKVLIYPTETLWGMGASVRNKQAIQKIFHLKNRLPTQPISLLVKDIKMAKQYASLTEPILTYMEILWPGPVTFVVPAQPTVPKEIHTGTHWVGLRCSSHPFLQKLMEKRSTSITSTSANISHQKPITKTSQLSSIFQNIHCVASDEVLTGPGSTVVKWEENQLVCLREGALPFSHILSITASVVISSQKKG